MHISKDDQIHTSQVVINSLALLIWTDVKKFKKGLEEIHYTSR